MFHKHPSSRHKVYSRQFSEMEGIKIFFRGAQGPVRAPPTPVRRRRPAPVSLGPVMGSQAPPTPQAPVRRQRPASASLGPVMGSQAPPPAPVPPTPPPAPPAQAPQAPPPAPPAQAPQAPQAAPVPVEAPQTFPELMGNHPPPPAYLVDALAKIRKHTNLDIGNGDVGSGFNYEFPTDFIRKSSLSQFSTKQTNRKMYREIILRLPRWFIRKNNGEILLAGENFYDIPGLPREFTDIVMWLYLRAIPAFAQIIIVCRLNSFLKTEGARFAPISFIFHSIEPKFLSLISSSLLSLPDFNKTLIPAKDLAMSEEPDLQDVCEISLFETIKNSYIGSGLEYTEKIYRQEIQEMQK